MSSDNRWGLTVDQAVAQLMIAERIADDKERRTEYRRIAERIRSLGYHDGAEEEAFYQDW